MFVTNDFLLGPTKENLITASRLLVDSEVLTTIEVRAFSSEMFSTFDLLSIFYNVTS